jgi:hypothetical protein
MCERDLIVCQHCPERRVPQFVVVAFELRDGEFPDGTLGNDWFPDAASLICEACAEREQDLDDCYSRPPISGSEEDVDCERSPGEMGHRVIPTGARPFGFSVPQSRTKQEYHDLTPELRALIVQRRGELTNEQGKLFADELARLVANYIGHSGWHNW